MNLFKRYYFVPAILIAFILLVSACGQDSSEKNSTKGSGDEGDKINIGLSVVDLTLERWQHDRDIFIERAEELGAEVKVESADGDSEKQLSQIQNMLSQDIDVLVVIAVDSDALSPVVDQAKEEGVLVVAYDRLINNTEIDAYVSFDNEGVGEMQAEYLIDMVPKGKYFLLGGSPDDHTAHMFRQGQMNILQPLIDSGDIEVVGDQWADGYSTSESLSIIENALTKNNNDIDVIVAPNDSTAGGAIQALDSQNLAGKVAVSGQDADLAGVQRVAEGTQSMTVYKPLREIATESAEIAVKLAKGEEIEAETTINNETMDVPFSKLDPISVDKDNLVDILIADEFHSYDDVYKNVPEDERPPKE